MCVYDVWYAFAFINVICWCWCATDSKIYKILLDACAQCAYSSGYIFYLSFESGRSIGVMNNQNEHFIPQKQYADSGTDDTFALASFTFSFSYIILNSRKKTEKKKNIQSSQQHLMILFIIVLLLLFLWLCGWFWANKQIENEQQQKNCQTQIKR